MGNCIRHESPMQWGGDDWSSTLTGPDEEDDEEEPVASRGLPGPNKLKNQPSHAVAMAEIVKVRITKRRLEDLLGKVDVKEMSAHQAVAQLLSTSAVSHHRPWRPALQSIPEGN